MWHTTRCSNAEVSVADEHYLVEGEERMPEWKCRIINESDSDESDSFDQNTFVRWTIVWIGSLHDN